jgi:hypothetical protein
MCIISTGINKEKFNILILKMFSAFHIKNYSHKEGGIGSYSCLSCRLKKKKCDRKLPVCSRCNQYKLECEPFERSVKYSRFSRSENNIVTINNKGN